MTEPHSHGSFFPADDPLLWVGGSFVLRLGEAVITSVPDLLIGLLLAGLLRHLLGDVRLRHAFRTPARRPFALLGILLALPTGAIGVLPVAWVLRRAGVGLAAVVVVLLFGGVLTPLSLAYLLNRIDVVPALVLVLLLGLAAWAVAAVVERLADGGAKVADNAGADVAPGLLPGIDAARSLLAAVWPAALVGVIVHAAQAALLPPSFLGEVLHDASAIHALLAGVLPTVGVARPELVALLVDQAANGAMPGAAFAVLLGGGVSVGTFFAAARLGESWRWLPRTLACFVVALGLGAVVLQGLPRFNPADPEDSHAFDSFSRPFHVLDHPDSAVVGVAEKWAELLTAPAVLCSAALLVIAVVPWGRLGASRRGRYIELSRLRMMMVVAAGVWIVGTVYVYFPSAKVVLEEARHAEGDLNAARGRDDLAAFNQSLHRLQQLAHRGQVGSLLRADTASANALAEVIDQANTLAETTHNTHSTPTLDQIVPLLQSLSAAR